MRFSTRASGPLSRRSSVLALAALAAGCSSPGGGGDAPDASAPTVAASSASPRLAPGYVRGVREELARWGFDRVVRGDGQLAAQGDGFVAAFATPHTTAPAATVKLPLRATAPFELAKGTMRVSVTLLGAKPVQGVIDDDAVVYPAAIDGGTLFHVPTTQGTEEYVRYDARPEPPQRSQLRYRLAFDGVAGLRLVDGDVFELLDRDGNPVLRTTAPWVFDANGTMRRGALALEDCAHDASAAAPWGRPVVAPKREGCTLRATWDDEGLAYPLLVDPPWTTTGSLATARWLHAASRITGSGAAACASGCVLVTGGISGGTTTGTTPTSALTSAELYNVATGTWASAGSTAARREHAQVDNFNGTATVFGGATTNHATTPTATASTQTYNPSSGWTTNTAMPAARWAHAALRVGSTYVTGGFASGGTTAQSTMYVFNGTSWSTGTAMAAARARHVMAPFDTGTTIACDGFVVAGGESTSVLDSVAHYGIGAASGCAATGWKNLATKMSAPRTRFAAASTSAGLLLFGGGTGLTESTHIVDVVGFSSPNVTVGPWKNGTTTITTAKRTSLTATTVTMGGKTRVVLAAGSGEPLGPGSSATRMTELVDPSSRTVVTGSPLNHTRSGHTATPLPNGSVLIAGGAVCSFGCTAVAAAEIFAFQANGQTCAANDECTSGFCVDGVCCNSACTGQCQGCNEAGSVGTCKTVSGEPRGTRAACPTPNTGTCGYRCNGVNATACVAAGSTTECTAPTCVSGIATPASLCNGSGTCVAQAAESCGKFACEGTACGAPPCANNADCASGYKCDTASKDCVPTGGVGSPCDEATDCSGGLSCVDGVCCTASSCSGGRKCNVPGAEGSCKLPYGTACTAATATDCATGNCVDGVCCDTPCNGQCEQCNLTGFVGACKPVPAGGKPVGGRTACSGTGACQASCDGTSRVTCGPAPGPTVVCAAAVCTSGNATPTRYCNGLGACSAASAASCGSYKCDPTACKTSCSTNADCATGYFCNASNQCVSTGADGTACGDDSECASNHCVDGVCCKTASCGAGLSCAATTNGTCAKPIAASCTTNAECGSGFCADGVCCNGACTGQCEACDVGGVVGSCTAITGDPRPGKPACAGTGACQAKCDGSDRTKCGAPPGTSTICAAESCSGTAYTPTSFCNGAGACSTAPVSSCGAYQCDATKCKSSCISSADCAPGYGCKSGLCETTGALGTICTDPSQCTSGKCVAGSGGKTVCCSVDSCADGSVCADESAGDRAGTCVKPRGTACTSKDECVSGFCVDGVCCAGACTGQCEACDVPGAEGTCSAVTGAPRGSRPACFDGGSEVCKAQACDGNKDRTKCTAFKNGVETECVPGTCDGRTETAPSRCDGSGECKAGSTKDCGGYVCGSTACKTSCATNGDCAPGYSCSGGKCESIKAKCSDDGARSEPLDGSAPRECSPFRCDVGSGTCIETCASSTDCLSGALCDGGRCVFPPAADTGDSGGCAASPRAASTSLSGAAIAALLVGLAARRRRARRC